MKLIAILSALIALAAGSTPALAQKKSSPRADQILAVYAPPKEAKHQAIHDALRSRRVLERLAQYLGPLRLPRRLTLTVDSCDGEVNAFYADDAVTVCYEYLDYVMQSAPAGTTAGGMTRTNVIIATTIDVFLHEAGHAVFDLLEVPVFGREEDAADLFSAYIMLQFAPADAQRMIRGVAYLGAKEAKEAHQNAPELKAFADAHGLPAQRYFNVLCMAYGFDAKTYADAITRGGLTEARAEGCADEYAMLDRAFKKLIMPHVDRKRMRKVRRAQRLTWDTPERP